MYLHRTKQQFYSMQSFHRLFQNQQPKTINGYNLMRATNQF